MDNSLSTNAQPPPRRRRRSGKKSSKTIYQQRRRWKNIGFWLLAGLIGGIAVAGIAVLAGGSSS